MQYGTYEQLHVSMCSLIKLAREGFTTCVMRHFSSVVMSQFRFSGSLLYIITSLGG
jgi:hypothetical protein